MSPGPRPSPALPGPPRPQSWGRGPWGFVTTDITV